MRLNFECSDWLMTKLNPIINKIRNLTPTDENPHQLNMSRHSLHLSSLNLSLSYFSFKNSYTSSLSCFTCLNHTILCYLPKSSFYFLLFLCFSSSLNFYFPANSISRYSSILWSGLNLLSVGGSYFIIPWYKWFNWRVYRLKQYWSGMGVWVLVHKTFSLPVESLHPTNLFQNPWIESYSRSFLNILPSTEAYCLVQDF